MGQIVFGIIFVIAGIANIYCGIRPNMSDYVLKTEVVKAMSGDWTVNTFKSNETVMADVNGDTTFYSAKNVQGRIDKLNKVLKG